MEELTKPRKFHGIVQCDCNEPLYALCKILGLPDGLVYESFLTKNRVMDPVYVLQYEDQVAWPDCLWADGPDFELELQPMRDLFAGRKWRWDFVEVIDLPEINGAQSEDLPQTWGLRSELRMRTAVRRTRR